MLEYSPAEYRDRVFHVETADDGSEWEVWNGQRMPAVGLSGTAGFPDEKVQQVLSGAIPYSQVRPAGWDAALRLADMDMDGIDVSVLYPTRLLGLQSFTDLDFTVVQARAYNGWLSDHVQQAPGRLYGAAVLPAMHDADGVAAVAAEIRRAATLPGIVSVLIRPNPSVDWRPFNDPVYDPIWAAAAETALPIGLHPFLVPDLPGAARAYASGWVQGPGTVADRRDTHRGSGSPRRSPTRWTSCRRCASSRWAASVSGSRASGRSSSRPTAGGSFPG